MEIGIISTKRGDFTFQSADDAIKFMRKAAQENDDIWISGEQPYPCLAVFRKVVYANCSDINCFANRMYCLWESLPGNIQDIEPFWTLSYADDPLSWGDEEQTRNIYEHMLSYYKD